MSIKCSADCSAEANDLQEVYRKIDDKI